MNTMMKIKSTFDIDDQFGPLEGIFDPQQRWNGWAQPWFTMASALVIQQKCNETIFNVYEEGTIFAIDSDGIWELDQAYADEYEDVRGKLVPTIEVDGVTYYGLGDGWCWSECENTTERLIALHSEWAQISDACAPNIPTTSAALARRAEIVAEIAALESLNG